MREFINADRVGFTQLDLVKDYLIGMGFTDTGENTVMKHVQITKDDLIPVEISLYQPRNTVWMRVRAEHEFFEEGIVYQGRVKTINFLQELYDSIQF